MLSIKICLEIILSLTQCMLGTKSPDHILKYFFFIFSNKTGFDISCKFAESVIVNLHEMSNHIYGKKIQKVSTGDNLNKVPKPLKELFTIMFVVNLRLIRSIIEISERFSESL